MASATYEYSFHSEKVEVVNHLRSAARWLHQRQANLCRPSVILQARLSSYSDVYGREFWQASYGELIETGETPEEAFRNFDLAWNGIEDDE